MWHIQAKSPGIMPLIASPRAATFALDPAAERHVMHRNASSTRRCRNKASPRR